MGSRSALVTVFAFAALAAAVCLAGCTTYQPPTDGQLFVSRPQVFTRERLVEARLREYQWLENRLRDLKPEEGFQGLSDVRLARSFGSKSTFTLTPAAVAGTETAAATRAATRAAPPPRRQPPRTAAGTPVATPVAGATADSRRPAPAHPTSPSPTRNRSSSPPPAAARSTATRT